jgi:hypothetical protein
MGFFAQPARWRRFHVFGSVMEKIGYQSAPQSEQLSRSGSPLQISSWLYAQ